MSSTAIDAPMGGTDIGRPRAAALTAAVFFGIGNIAYRFGDGNALAIAGQRCLVGVILMTPFVWRSRATGPIRNALRDPHAVAAAVVSGLNLVVTGVMLRTLTGPQVALAVATIHFSCLRRGGRLSSIGRFLSFR